MYPGSSPRVRGKLDAVDEALNDLRLIPARAGKTRPMYYSRRTRPAHPRACGENPAVIHQGTSSRWLIPARAGKTGGVCCGAQRDGAHPRACGENLPEYFATAGRVGSSPRVRGKRVGRQRIIWCLGLIPARAGKTRPRSASRSSTGAHPRACGENGDLLLELEQVGGSSPRVRGKHDGDAERGDGDGLIPARAGKTAWRWT